MKFTTALTVLAVVAVQAAAVPEARPAAQPEAVAEADPRRVKTGRLFRQMCGVPGQACLRVRSAEPEADPRRVKTGRLFRQMCGVPGQACLKTRGAPDHEVGNEVGFCGTPGQPCAQVKRSANAIAEALAEADADPRRVKTGRLFRQMCGVPGQACLKARDLIDKVVDHTNDVYGAVYEREAAAEPEAEADPRRVKTGRLFRQMCGVPGQSCLRVRSAEALADANAMIKRDADADPRRVKTGRLFRQMCGVPGQACLKARDAEAAAEAINKIDPSIFKKTCFAEGGDCDTLLKVQKAFHASKQAGADERKIQSPQAKLAHCGGKNECTILTHAHQYAKQHGPRSADEAEAVCNGAEGLCTLAQRDLDGIENTINEAVDAMLAEHAGIEDGEDEE